MPYFYLWPGLIQTRGANHNLRFTVESNVNLKARIKMLIMIEVDKMIKKISQKKNFNKIRISLLALLAFFFMSSVCWAATYYIDATAGNDGNSGTLSSPWRTISKANSTLQAGDAVFIKKGTYKETIRPNNSGTKGNYITYARYGTDEVIITGVSDAVNLQSRHYIIIDGLKIIDVSERWVNLGTGSPTYNIIRNCYMETAGNWSGIWMGFGANYNQILNNTLISTCTGAPNDGPRDLIYCQDNSYNLFEGNDFKYGAHQCLDILGDTSDTAPSGYHVIRNNTFHNPWHTALCLTLDVKNCLIEGNIFLDSGEEYYNNYCGSDRDRSMSRSQQKGLQLSASNNIVRKNFFTNNGSMSVTSWEDGKFCYDNRVYNNTFYKDYKTIESSSGLSASGSVFKNNIIDASVEYAISLYNSSNVFFVNNNISGGKIKFGDLSNPEQWYDNLAVNPQFIDPVTKDCHLQSTSPMIDAGTFLTKTTGAGYGTSIPVADSTYFMDGWGIINGDLIQLQGSKQILRIVNIKSDTITVDQNISWDNGTGVSLVYNGSAPDIGAFEFENEYSDLQPPRNLRATN